MSYLEELLPEFRKGAKIRRSNWPDGHCVKLDTNKEYTVDNDNKIYTIYAEELLADNWELYQEPEPDWDYIIKNKCLCWFWNDKGKKFIKFLKVVEKCGYRDEYGMYWQHCRPVRRDEVTFYEDRKDEHI